MLDSPLSHDESERVERHLWLVDVIVAEFRVKLPKNYDTSDLTSAGRVGLMKAARKFLDGQSTFSSYAAIRIRGEIGDHLRRDDWCSRSTRVYRKRFHTALREMEQQQGGEVSCDEVLAKVATSAIDRNRISFAVNTAGPTLSLEEPQRFSNGEMGKLADRIPDESVKRSSEQVERYEMIDRVAEGLSLLPERDTRILVMSYLEGKTLDEIAKVVGLTSSRVCQIRDQACRRVRKTVQRQL